MPIRIAVAPLGILGIIYEEAMSGFATGAMFAGVIILMIVIRVFSDRFDRERIRDQVESHGGRVLNISWNPFGSGWPATRSARLYDVRYHTHHGEIVSATCATSWTSGVCWMRDKPPGFGEIGESAGVSTARRPSPEDIAQSSATPAEAIACLRCGARIPARTTHCPKCGWSYQSG
jgi:ribosomal protein L40E